MLLAFIGFLILIGCYIVKHSEKKWEFTELTVWFGLFIASVFIFYDLYYYFILPAEIGTFYNSGNGISFLNGTKNFSAFSNYDEKIGFYVNKLTYDMQNLDLLLSVVWFLIPLALILYAFDWMGKNTAFGEKVFNRGAKP